MVIGLSCPQPSVSIPTGTCQFSPSIFPRSTLIRERRSMLGKSTAGVARSGRIASHPGEWGGSCCHCVRPRATTSEPSPALVLSLTPEAVSRKQPPDCRFPVPAPAAPASCQNLRHAPLVWRRYRELAEDTRPAAGAQNRFGNADAAHEYPTKIAASMRKCATTSGSTRPYLLYSQPNSIPIAKLPMNAPKPW